MHNPSRAISIRSPAKINLVLDVLGRTHDGYHNIRSLMQMVGLYDHLQFRTMLKTQGIRLTVDGYGGLSNTENLILQATKILLRRYKVDMGLEIHLHKNIPISAGLGGGSSNAAATLVALDRLLGIGASKAELVAIARSLGSDVPFFLSGPAAIVEGTGERVQPLRPAESGWVVLIKDQTVISTGWAFRRYDQMVRNRRGDPVRPSGRNWLTSLRKPNKIDANSRTTFRLTTLPQYLHNDLEEVTQSAYPVVGRMKSRLSDLGAAGALMSGSGPTVFGLFDECRSAQRVARILKKEQTHWAVWVARFLKRSPYVIRRSSNG